MSDRNAELDQAWGAVEDALRKLKETEYIGPRKLARALRDAVRLEIQDDVEFRAERVIDHNLGRIRALLRPRSMDQ